MYNKTFFDVSYFLTDDEISRNQFGFLFVKKAFEKFPRLQLPIPKNSQQVSSVITCCEMGTKKLRKNE